MQNKKIRSPQSPSHLRESALSGVYSTPLFLSPIWRVIFQEAMRGHDLLFDGEIYRSSLEKNRISTMEEDHLSEVGLHLLQSSSLRDMKSLINSLSSQQKVRLGKIFQCTLTRWKKENLNSLN